MKIDIIKEKSLLILSKDHIHKIVKYLLSYLHISCDEIAIYFVGKNKIKRLHEKYFQDPSVTDCITFPIDKLGDIPCFLGEIFICQETAIEYAKKNNINSYDETLLYLIHGILHLCGFDDKTDIEQRKMRKKEKECMSKLKGNFLALSKIQENLWKKQTS